MMLLGRLGQGADGENRPCWLTAGRRVRLGKSRLDSIQENFFGDDHSRVRKRHRSGAFAPGDYAFINAGQAVKQVSTIENVGEQFLRGFAQHDGGDSGAIACFDDQRQTAAGE